MRAPTEQDYHDAVANIVSDMQALGDNFVSAFVTGSMALGKIRPGTSDIDMGNVVSDKLIRSWDEFQRAYKVFFGVTDTYEKWRARLWTKADRGMALMQPTAHLWLLSDLQHVVPFVLYFNKPNAKTVYGPDLWPGAAIRLSDQLAYTTMPRMGFYGQRQDMLRAACREETMDDWDHERCIGYIKLIQQGMAFARCCVGMFDSRTRVSTPDVVEDDFGRLENRDLIGEVAALRAGSPKGKDVRTVAVRAAALFDEISLRLCDAFADGKVLCYGGTVRSGG